MMGGLLHLVQRGGDWAGRQPAQAPPRCTRNVTAHPSTASVPVTVLLYNGPLLCGFNVGTKGLTKRLKLSDNNVMSQMTPCFSINQSEKYLTCPE